MLWLVGLVLGLPLSVWLLATLCAAIDEPKPLPPLLRVSLAICLVLAVMLATNVDLIYPLLASFITVLILHTASFFIVRQFGTGATVYERTPPRPPLLQDEIADEN